MADNFETLLKSGFKEKTSKALNYFWIGFIIYSASFALSTTSTVNFIACQMFQIFGLVLMIPAVIKLIQWRFDNNYLKILYILYCSWLLSIIFRGFSFDYSSLKNMLFDAQSGLLRYFVPLILLFPKKLPYYKKLFTVILFLGLVFIIYDILFIDNLMDLNYENYDTKFTFEYFTKILSIPCGFILLTFIYHSKRRILFALFIIFVNVSFAIFRARRALIFMTLSPLVICYLLYLYSCKRKFLIIFFSLIIGSFLFFYAIKVYNQNKYSAFSLITDRIYDDSRTGVEKSFYDDMNTQDWIIGKGINGQYYCPGIDLSNLTGYRSMIETDYLNIILKGGIISLGLLLLILIPAIFKGIFRSRNLISKAAGFWIFLWLISLYPATVNTFSLNYLLVWISIGICYSNEIRSMSESRIKEIFSTKSN
jgi:hypothetical protein